MIVVVMGVAGVGKTEVGRALAARLGAEFRDADDHHPPENVRSMTEGRALDEADRAAWLASLNELLRDAVARGAEVVLACSALTPDHRSRLLEGVASARLVFLSAPADVIRQRLRDRRGHFFPPELLDSQLELLEPPETALRVDARLAPEVIVEQLARQLGGDMPGTATDLRPRRGP